MARKILLAFGVPFSTTLVIVMAFLLINGAARQAVAQETTTTQATTSAGTLEITHPVEITEGEFFNWSARYIGPLTVVGFESQGSANESALEVFDDGLMEGGFEAVAPGGSSIVSLSVTVTVRNPIGLETITGSALIPVVGSLAGPTVEIIAPDMVSESDPDIEYGVITSPEADDVKITVTTFGEDGVQIRSTGAFSFGPSGASGVIDNEFEDHQAGTVEIEATATFFASDPSRETIVVVATKKTVLVKRDDVARGNEVDQILALNVQIRLMDLSAEELGILARLFMNDVGLDQARDALMERDLFDLELIKGVLKGAVLRMGSNATSFGGEMDDTGADQIGALHVSQQEGATPIEQVIENLFGEFESIFAWDETAQAFVSFRPNLPAALNSLQELRPGDAVWVSVTGPNGALWDSPLINAAREVQLLEGFNFVTWTGPAGTPVAEAVESFGDALEAVFFWDRDTESFLTFRPALPELLNTLLQLPLQSAMWVLVSEDAVWSQPPR